MLKDHSHLDTSDSNEFVLYFLRHVVEDYTINLKQISHRIKQATEHLRAHRLERDDFVDFVSIEDDLSNILTSLAPIPPILKRLVDSEDTILNQAHARKAEDVSLAIEQSINTCNADLRRIVSVREAYSTISNNSLNGTMKTLTMVTLLIALPNVIFGMYGMNIGLPIQRETWAYFAVIGGTFLIVLVAYVIAKIKKVF
jgi:magnesium transporter